MRSDVPSLRRAIQRLRLRLCDASGRVRHFAVRTDGASIVEFAVLLPVLLLLYMHLVDFTRAFNERKRVVRLSGTLSDLVAQQSTTKAIASNLLTSVFGVASAVMTPYPSDNVKMTVSVLRLTPRADGSCCDARVKWTAAQGGTLRPCGILAQVDGSVPPRPDNIVAGMISNYALGNAASAELIVADVSDAYQPMFSVLNRFFTGGFEKTTYSFPRGTGALVLQPLMLTGQQRICL